jgi:two-component system, NtrC family, sensor kinase
MKSSDKVRGKTGRAQRRKPPAPKRQNAPKVSDRGVSLSEKTDPVVLTRERDEAVEQLKAAAEVLRVIASSSKDVKPVFEAIVESACKLCEAADAYLALKDGDCLVFQTQHGPIPIAWKRRPINRQWPAGRAVVDGKSVHLRDVLAREGDEFPDGREIARQDGARTVLTVPLMREGESTGVIILRRTEVQPFTDKQIALLKTFADQAVIAIENARLFNETQEALERQTATADILRVIASSPDDVQPVFQIIAERSNELVSGLSTSVLRLEDDVLHMMAYTRLSPDADAALKVFYPKPLLAMPWGESVRQGKVFITTDIEDDETPTESLHLARLRGWRSVLIVPLLSGRTPIGAISVTRREPGGFAENHVQLLKTFADQAVIAIQNVKLFEEVQAKTRDLEVSLQQQTATSDVLKVISRSAFDLQTVFDTLVKSAVTLSGARVGTIFQERCGLYHLTAQHGAPPEILAFGRAHPIAPDMNSSVGRTAVTGTAVQIPDVFADPHYKTSGYQRIAGFRALLAVPLIRDGKVEGVFSLGKQEPGPFAQRQVELIQTFADQAVIAIGNVRLFEEVQAKTRDIEEALRYQTGSANILNVIASSPTDVAPVLKAIVESACELCGAYDAVALLKEGNYLLFGAHHGPIPIDMGALAISRNWTPGLAVIEQKPVHIHDLLSSEGDQVPEAQRRAREFGYRTILSVPMLREKESIGVLALRRAEAHPFSDKQISLLQTFADQAVIAIGNVRLFEEVQQRTRDLSESLQQQTATAEVLKVISRSTFDLPAVLHALVETAARLCGAEKGTITRQKNGVFYRAESYGFSDEFMDFVRGVPVTVDRLSATGRALLEGVVVHIPDVDIDRDYSFSGQRFGDFRSLLGVPMLREGVPVGVITLTRTEPSGFSDKQIELATTFADQAAIAIENVRLFDEVQARTKELAKSLDDLRAAQDRLIQTEKLASLGQLTAGIAHEIKNPLNFVNNFSALSVELTDELKDVLKRANLIGKIQAEVDEITGLLRDNLGKVVQHGKRADSIVKNMLLHSREGSGEHRSVDINAIVEDSLNLAYHGARAEKSGFTITLKHDLDPSAGAVELYPQEVTRALLNLISNGFYAAVRRKVESGDESFEPVLSASTRNLGKTIEIRIRDNGAGIPPEVKEKIFVPFFTTKPTGEGTGLGLSMTHDIIVKQHGGRIDVETELGVFTEFIITLPRGDASGQRPE